MCFCVNWSPGWTILLNCEVGEFQASVRDCYIRILRRLSLTNFIYPCPPHLYQSLSGSYYFLLLLPPPHKYISTKPHLYLCITRSPQPLLAWYVVHLYLSPILHLPVSYDCLCAPRRGLLLLPCPVSVFHFLSALSLRPGPCWSLGVVRHWSLHLLFVPDFLTPHVILRLLSSPGLWYLTRWNFSCANVRGPGASTPWQ